MREAQERGAHLGKAAGHPGSGEKRRKKAKAKVGKLKDQASKQILEAKIHAMKEFKISSEMRDLNVAFGQEAFQKGYEFCED
ncbi:hypothetical protein COCNU_06G017930 [Cocos nucifera]|uniref:Uncharacterized protein n=1 Tax=Cocos nucifera TaxID=13894 RepID=A0A8K0N3Y7_COCNU|nr:hypothetical protein COCNU_06G017930 [Cocos nucifera]